MSSSDLDIGDVEKEQFNSDYNSSSGDDSKGSSEPMTDLKEKEEEEEEKKANENQQNNMNNQANQEGKGSESKSKINQMINGNNENKGQNINEIKGEKKSSKTNSKKSKSNIPGAEINNNDLQKEKEFNRFFIPQYNKRLETLMNIESENSEEETNDNEMERMKKEVEIIKKEKEAKRKFHKTNDINFKIQGFPKNYMDSKRINELSYQRDKIKYLEEKNLELDRLNQMYYDFIRSTNLEVIKNDIDNNNYTKNLKLQSLDGVNNNMNMNPIQNPLNNFSQDNLDFAIKSYIEVERNKNIHNFNDSMIDINQKITNYLIDNCQEEKEKNKRLQDFKNEIGQKLDKIEYIQKKQKHDIDYIIKYGLNKNNDLNPIVGLFNDYQKTLPKLLKDIDDDENYETINKKNFTPYKNFYLHGRYSNKDYENDDISSDKSKNRDRKFLQRTGSCIFENRKNPFYYKLKENEEYKDLNPNIKRPFFDNKNNNSTKEKKEKKRNKYDDTDYEDEEFQKFVAYKGRYFIPADFRFGQFKERKKHNDIFKKNKNEIDFII